MSELTNRVSELSALKLALLASRMRDGVEGIEYLNVEPIAIVGMGCRYPGGANDPETFWDNLRTGVDAVREVPENKWNAEAFYAADRDAKGKIYTKWGAYLDQVDLFDANFFGISGKEAKSMDPQQRLALEVACEALEDAGIPLEKIAGTKAGVFMGVGQTDYSDLELKAPDVRNINAYTGTGLLFSAVSGRISYALGLHGPSETVDGACASSLMTMHLAMQSLRAGECETALAGGVHLVMTPNMTVYLSRSQALAPDGRCKTFDASANGYSRGEGCGVVVLKRLSDALKAGDRIVALLRGAAVNHGGASQGFTVPNGLAQQMVVREALENAGVRPDQVSYIEAHGTGTSLGDPIEVNALGQVFGGSRKSGNHLMLGSVKTNIGHLEAAAGVAGLMKVALALKNKKIPPHLHFKTPNPHLELGAIPAEVPTQLTDWNQVAGRRVAGVSSFGITGQNAHVILEEAPAVPQKALPEIPDRARLLTFSAKTESALRESVDSYLVYLNSDAGRVASLRDIAANINLRRSHFESRLAVAAKDKADLARQLESFLREDEGELFRARSVMPGRPAIAFVYSGQGPQWWAMGRDLYGKEPVFRAAIDDIAGMLDEYADWSLKRELLEVDEAASRLGETAIAQPAIFALQMALTDLWRARGVRPGAVVGHSVGEVAAACASGILTRAEAVRVIYHRARFMQEATGLGKMAAVELPAARMKPYLKGLEGRLELGAINGPTSSVLSGEEAALKEVLARLEKEGVHTKLLPVNYAFHSPQMEPFRAKLVAELGTLSMQPATTEVYSTVTGKAAKKNDYDAQYWGRNIREAVSFAPAIDAMARDGYNVFIEISAHPVLGNYVAGTLEAGSVDDVLVAGSLHRKIADEGLAFAANLGAAWTAGATPNFAALYAEEGDGQAPLLDLPAYPWQHRSFWVDHASGTVGSASASAPVAAAGVSGDGHPFTGSRVRSPLDIIQFESVFTAESPYFLKDHVLYDEIVVPGASHMSLVLTGARRALGNGNFEIEDSFFHQALVIPKDGPRYVQLILAPEAESAGASTQDYSFKVSSIGVDEAERGEWIQHATGKLRLLPDPPSAPLFDAQAVQKTLQKEMTGEEFYKDFREKGYHLYDTFCWIDHLWRKNGEVLGRMKAPANVNDAGDYVLFPSLFDAFYQLGTWALPREGLGAFLDGRHIYVPWNNNRFQFNGDYKGEGTDFWCHITCHDTDQSVTADQQVFRGDLKLYDLSGALVGEIKDWALKRVNSELLLKSLHKSGDWLFGLDWNPAEIKKQRPKHSERGGAWLLLADGGGAAEAVAKALEERGEFCVLARPGADYQAIDARHYEVNPTKVEDFDRLLQDALFSDEGKPCRGIVQMWGLDLPDPAETTGARQIAKDVELLCGGILHLGQALAKAEWAENPRLWLLTRGAFGGSPVQSTLWGLGRVIALENPEVWRGLIELDSKTIAGLQGDASGAALAPLVAELQQTEGDDHIQFRDAQRFTARLRPINFESRTGAGEVALSPEACYLVSGGLGALGLELAAWMAGRGAGHIVLTGRSAPSPEAEKQLERLRAGGADVQSLRGDVTDPADAARLIEAANKIAPLRGIVHAAGVLDDGVLVQQTWERFATVLAPKD
ncbi:MAG: SDR family NAD(P)-dependent oxidoreductase, partial [Leptospirales bacterium]